MTSVDRRPSKLLVSGYDVDDKTALIEHFSKFGEILNTVYDDFVPSVIIHFKTRRFAEQAMAGGRNFADQILSLTW